MYGRSTRALGVAMPTKPRVAMRFTSAHVAGG